MSAQSDFAPAVKDARMWPSDVAPRASRVRPGVVVWGVLGVVALVVQALWRLTPIALEPLNVGGLTLVQGVVYAGWVVFNGYAEGYRGFQKRFSPRVVARAFFVARHGRWIDVVAAPFFCMGLYGAQRRVVITSWCLLVAIVGLVVLVRHLAQPWRGIIDGGVVVGLVWGVGSLLVLLWRAWEDPTRLADPKISPPPSDPDAGPRSKPPRPTRPR